MLSSRASLGSIRHRGHGRHGALRNGVACALAGVAFLATREQLDAPAASWGARSVPVVVAARDVPPGAIIDRNALTVARYATGTPAGDAYANVDSVANRVTRVAISKGEVITPSSLAPEINSTGLALKIGPGKRAYTIRIDKTSMIGGMLRPNARVDIIVVNVDPELGQRVAKLFLSNVRVLAVGKSVERTSDRGAISEAVATVEVTPTEAEQLAVSAAQGPLQLVVRGTDDRDTVGTNGAVADDVFAAPRSTTPAQNRRSRRQALNRLVPSPTSSRRDTQPPTVFRRNRLSDNAPPDTTRRPK